MQFTSSVSAAEYYLKKDDTVRSTVFGEEDLTVQAQIGKSGDVSFPLIGNVKLVGLSLKQAEKKLKALYERDYLHNAQVSLAIEGYAENWVIVGGDVGRPGTIKFPEAGALNLRGALAQAGGALESANTSRIFVRRKNGASNIYSLAKSGNITLRHGDTVTVTRSSISRSSFTVSGLVGRPGLVTFPKEGRISIVTAIAEAGGFTAIANKKVVTVRRGKNRYVVNLKDIEKGKAQMFYMAPGDILTVKESVL